MDRISRKIFLTTVCGYTFSFAFLYSYSLLQFSPRDTLQQYFWQWVFDNTLEAFLSTLIPVTCATLGLSYSLYLNSEEARKKASGTQTFFSLFKGVLPILLVFLVAYVILTESVLPDLNGRRQEMTYRTARIRELQDETQTAVDSGNLPEARKHLLEYLSLNPEDRKTAELLDTITRRLEDTTEQPKEESRPVKPAAEISSMTATKLIAEALAYLEHEDYYSAHYYASIASQLDPTRTEAQRIMALAWGRISAPGTDRENRELQQLYDRKRDGYAALMRGETLTAYAIFSSLKTAYPADRDVEEYYARSSAALEQESFFIDEVDDIPTRNGRRDVFFRNTRTEEYSEFLYMKKIVEKGGQFYAENIEALAFEENGKIRYHLRAPYGKISGKRLLLLAIDRNNPGTQLIPVYLQGSREKAFSSSIMLEIEPEMLFGLSTQAGTLETLNLLELYRLSADYEKFGYRREHAQLELLQRMMQYFNFIIFSFLAIGIGWFLRSRYPQKMPVFMYLLIPLLPFAMNYILQLLFYAQRVCVSLFLLTAGMEIGIGVLVGLELVLLFGALLFLSGQVSGND